MNSQHRFLLKELTPPLLHYKKKSVRNSELRNNLKTDLKGIVINSSK